ncbi:MAG: M28 family peptidase [Chitinophagales bacterium]|nr:M28 family peptidase [Chitinophagales bacterium]
MKIRFTIFLLIATCSAFSQTNIISTNVTAEEVMMGNYDPAAFSAPIILNHPDTIAKALNTNINADSLRGYLEKLGSFQNRNSGSDTISSIKGIGAARRWVYEKFQQFSTANNNRLLPSYLQFDLSICSIGQHRNVFAVLPGIDTTDHSIIIIESHLDSRCEGLCDTSCLAQGVDDNGSGTALVIELARVMSVYSFNHTIVFLTNIAEEQGLYGAEAFADYVQGKGIGVKAVLNNDIVGGVLCGHTSSPPSCSPFGDIDSTQIRLFSYGGFNSLHKGLVRFIKLEYKEELLPLVSVPMTISLMTGEDREGRGGDHIPFRQHGYLAVRFTSANENGDANVADTGYIDNQHTSRDVLGYDTDLDGLLDSFLVDFNYLARNTAINGNAAAMAAIGPKTPTFALTTGGNQVDVSITADQLYPQYRVGVRSLTYDWDSVYTFNSATGAIILFAAGTYYLSTATVDSNGVESLFSGEIATTITSVNDFSTKKGIQLLPAQPNPADESTMITINVLQPIYYKNASIRVFDSNGNLIKELPVKLEKGINEVLYHHGYNASGTYLYSLVIDGAIIETRKMVFGK